MQLQRIIFAAICACLSIPAATSQANEIPKLTIAVKKDRYNVDPHKFTFTTRRPAAQIVETAVRPDQNFNPQGVLFDKWSVTNGTYLIDIKKNIRFHDGQDFNADTAIAALKLYDQGKSDFLQIDPDSFVKTGPYQFRFKSEIGSALIIENMTHRATSFFSLNGDRSQNPIGTGPYLLKSYQPKQQITLTRNADYWGTKPNVAEITYRFIPDDQIRLLALQNKEIDIIAETTPQMLLSVPKDGSIKIHQSRPIRYVALLTNQQGKAPFDLMRNPILRQAIALGIDRQKLAEILYDGRGEVAQGLLPNWMFDLGNGHVKGYGYDPVQAEKLLDQDGWVKASDGIREKQGRRLTLRLVAAYPNVSSVKPMPELLQDMLRAIGIEIDLVEVDDSGVYGDRYLNTGEADLFMEFASNNNTDPTYLLYNLFHSKTPWTGYRHTAPGPHFDQILDQARQAATREEVIAKVRQAHKILIDQDLAAIPILMVPNITLSRPGLEIPMFEQADWIDYGQVGLTP